MALKKTTKLAIMFPPEPKTKEIKIIHMQTKFAESFAIFACLEKNILHYRTVHSLGTVDKKYAGVTGKRAFQ